MSQNSRQAPRVVVFDLGGVLFDWNPEHLYGRLIPDAAERRRFLTDICPRDWHQLQDAGNDPALATTALQAKFPSHAELIGAWYGRFDEMMAPPYPEMVALVGRLQAAGVGLHLLSNAPGFMTEWLATGKLRAAHPFLAAFGAIVVSGTVGCSKPDRAIYDLTATRGGFAPEEAVFLDDNLPNVDGAKAAGWRAIHHRDPGTTIAALRAMGLPV
jgi:2-haloacid dehalogenase